MPRLTASLNWLVTQTAYLKGREKVLTRKKKYHEKRLQVCQGWVKSHTEQLLSINESLGSVKGNITSFSMAIELHEIAVNTADIRPVTQHCARLASYGGIVRFVIAELQRSPTRSRYTSELGDALIIALDQTDMPDQKKKEMRLRLLSRLHNLAREKRIIKGNEPKYALDRQWSLP